MAAPTIALLGAGNIAEFHAAALRTAGFALHGVAARPGSKRVAAFASRHRIDNLYPDPESLLEDGDWDALLIAIDVEDTLAVLQRAQKASRPILVEKPVAVRSSDLGRFGPAPDVMVAYNRRFYRTSIACRAFAQQEGNAFGHLHLPESILPASAYRGPGHPLRPFFVNSVHGLDLVRYVFGDLELQSRDELRAADGQLRGLAATLRSTRGDLVQFTASFRSPSNFSLAADRGAQRFEMRPFESGQIYDGMTVVEPTAERPIRSYQPRLAQQVGLDPEDATHKPGFVAQARAFLELVRGKQPGTAARIPDARAALALAEALAGEPYPGPTRSSDPPLPG